MTRKKVYIGLSAITILVVVAAIIWLVAVLAFDHGGIIYYETRHPYNTIKSQIQTAVTEYTAYHKGERPPCEDSSFDVYVTYSNVTITCQVIDICALISTAGPMLRVVPDSLYGNSSQEHTNFYNSSDVYYEDCCENPLKDWGHYIWSIDSIGSVYSICDENRDGVYNTTDRVDGEHQDIWP